MTHVPLCSQSFRLNYKALLFHRVPRCLHVVLYADTGDDVVYSRRLTGAMGLLLSLAVFVPYASSRVTVREPFLFRHLVSRTKMKR